jgi:hypothetical protein
MRALHHFGQGEVMDEFAYLEPAKNAIILCLAAIHYQSKGYSVAAAYLIRFCWLNSFFAVCLYRSSEEREHHGSRRN